MPRRAIVDIEFAQRQDAKTTPAGGVSLLYREDKRTMPYRVENDLVAAPTIITFELVTGDKERCVGELFSWS